MLGCYDFCGHYDWTFRWIEVEAGEAALQEYWNKAIHQDSQAHAGREIQAAGVEGMKKYWGYTMYEEAPDGGYSTHIVENRFILEIAKCPSRGFLMLNHIRFSKDYCDHCMGWIGPMMKEAGFVVNHAHNHCGQCYWEFSPEVSQDKCYQQTESLKAAYIADWQARDDVSLIDIYRGANSVPEKEEVRK